MLKKALLKSFQFIRYRPLKIISRNFTFKHESEIQEFNFEETTNEYDFTKVEEDPFESEIDLFEKPEQKELIKNKKNSMLFKAKSLLDIENFINSLENEFPKELIGNFFKITNFIIINSSITKEINEFFINPNLRRLILDMDSYWNDQALDIDFIYYLQFLDFALKRGMKSRAFFEKNRQTKINFIEKLCKRIDNDNYKILSLVKILYYEKNNNKIKTKTKIKIIEKIRNDEEELKELDDLNIVRLFKIISEDYRPNDKSILEFLENNITRILQFDSDKLVRIFKFLSILNLKHPINKSFFNELIFKISPNVKNLDIFSLNILLQGFSDLEDQFYQIQEEILDIVLNNLENFPGFVYFNSLDIIKFFMKNSKKLKFSEQYEKFIDIMTKMDTKILPFELFLQKKKFYFLQNCQNKIINDLQPFFQNTINSEIDINGFVKLSMFIQFLNKDFLSKIWKFFFLNPKLIFYTYDIRDLQIIAIQNNLEVPKNYLDIIKTKKIKLNPDRYEMFKSDNNPEQQKKLLELFYPNSILKNIIHINFFDVDKEEFEKFLILNDFKSNLNLRINYKISIIKLYFKISEKFIKNNNKNISHITLNNIISNLIIFINNLDKKKLDLLKSSIMSLKIALFDYKLKNQYYSKNLFEMTQFYLKNIIFFSCKSKLERQFICGFFDMCVYYKYKRFVFFYLNLIYSNNEDLETKFTDDYVNYCTGKNENTKKFKFEKILNFLFLFKYDIGKKLNYKLRDIENKYMKKLSSGQSSLQNCFDIIFKFKFHNDMDIINLLKEKQFENIFFKMKKDFILKFIFIRYENNNSKSLAEYFKPILLNNIENFTNSEIQNMITCLKDFNINNIIEELGYGEIIDKLIKKLLKNSKMIFSQNEQNIKIMIFIERRGVYYPEILEAFDNNNIISSLTEMILINYFSKFDVVMKSEKIQKMLTKNIKNDICSKQILLVINNFEGDNRKKMLIKLFKNFHLIKNNFLKNVLLLWTKQNEPEIYENDKNLEKEINKINQEIEMEMENFEKLKKMIKFLKIDYEIFPKSENIILSNYFLKKNNIYIIVQENKINN